MSDLERGQVMRSDATPKMQTLQVQVWGDDDVRDDVEHFEPAGLAHKPSPPANGQGADALVGSLGGADHSVVLSVSDRRIRPTDLDDGDTTMYDGHGHRVDLTDTGAAVNCDTTVDGSVDASDGFKVGGSAGKSGIMTATLTLPGNVGVLLFVLNGGIITDVSATGCFAWVEAGV
jgi:phage baseplate assembly protein V